MAQVNVPGTQEVIEVPDDVPPDQFDAYIDDFKKSQMQQGSPAVGLFDRVSRAIQGQQDPNFAATPDYTAFARNASPQVQQSRPNLLPGFQPESMSQYDPALRPGMSDFAGVDDPGLANILKSRLGDRFRGIRNDANGYPLIRFIDQNGQEQEAYVNKPGLDYNDIQRDVSASVPYAVASGMGNVVARGLGAAGRGMMPFLTRMGIQGSAAADTSIAQDVAGMAAGSEASGPNFEKAAWAGIGGAGGEAVSTVGTKLFDWFRMRGLFKGGQLTPKGREIAARNGIDPDKMNADVAKQFARDMTSAQQPEWAVNKARAESEGLKGTTGDYTGDVEQQILESNLENRQLGQAGYETMQNFRRQQAQGVEEATNNFSIENFGHPREVAAGAGKEIQEGVRARYLAGKGKVDQAFSEVDRTRLIPDEYDRAVLGHYYKELQNDSPEVFQRLVSIDKATQPNAFAARGLLEQVVSGRAKQSGSKLMGTKGGAPLDFESIRRRISSFRDRAYASGNGADYKAVKDIADRYNEFLVHLGQNAEDTSDALKLMKAVDLHRQLNKTYRGDDPVGKFVSQLTSSQDLTPEGIVSKIMTSSGKSGTNSVPIIKRLKSILGESSPEWALLRATAFDNLVSGGKPGVLPADKVAANARTLLTRSSIYSELFDAKELSKIEDFMGQIARIGKKDLPPKMSSRQLSELQRVRKDGVLRYLFRRMGTRDTFQGRPFRGAAWHALARSSLSTPLYNVKEAGGKRLARDAVEGFLPQKPRSRMGTGGVGGAVGAEYGGSGW